MRHVRGDNGVLVASDMIRQRGLPEMIEEIRRAVARAAVARTGGQTQGSVYSHETNRHTPFSGAGPGGGGYDHDARAHIGDLGGGLYHHGLRAHISLQVNGDLFTGYDCQSRSEFSGRVSGSSVQLYDAGERRWFRYVA